MFFISFFFLNSQSAQSTSTAGPVTVTSTAGPVTVSDGTGSTSYSESSSNSTVNLNISVVGTQIIIYPSLPRRGGSTNSTSSGSHQLPSHSGSNSSNCGASQPGI